MGTRKPLVETKRKLKLGYGSRYLAQLQKPEIWDNIVYGVTIIEACHDGGPIAKWKCPWCKTVVMQRYEGTRQLHFCPQCIKATRLEARGYQMRERMPQAQRVKLRGMSSTRKGKSYRRLDCRVCAAKHSEPHKPTCAYVTKYKKA